MRHSLALVFAAALALPACRDEVSGAPRTTDTTPSPTAPSKPLPGTTPPATTSPTLPTPPALNESDTRIAQEIRMAIMDKASLSSNAHNVQVTCTDGVVTLRGPVDSEVERDTVGSLAQAVPGVTKVDNQLEVKP